MLGRKFGDRPPPPLPWWRVEAVGIGVIAALGLPMIIDQFFHAMNIFPPTRSLIVEVGDHVLALSYRFLAVVFGAFLASRIGPPGVYRSAAGVGVVVLLVNVAAAAIIRPEGPAWHLIAMVMLAVPGALLGGLAASAWQKNKRTL